MSNNIFSCRPALVLVPSGMEKTLANECSRVSADLYAVGYSGPGFLEYKYASCFHHLAQVCSTVYFTHHETLRSERVVPQKNARNNFVSNIKKNGNKKTGKTGGKI